MDNLEWNCWNLVLIRSDMKGIFRSVWIVWFDTYQGRSIKDGSKDFGLDFADPQTINNLKKLEGSPLGGIVKINNLSNGGG
jgi:hypothetical protein